MKKKKPVVFLSGPMRNIPRESGVAWRKQAQKLLSPTCDIISPYQGREKKEAFLDSRGAVIRDLRNIERADILVVNDTYKNASMIGTSMEVFYAHQLNKVVLVFGEAHKGDYFLEYHSHSRLPSLKEACKLILNLFI
jgi:nucleoside 2-deoxyribosyltransferase